MTTGTRFLSIPRDRRHVLALVALVLGLGELENTFTISFWEGAAVFSVLFLVGTVWIRRGGVGGPILVALLCAFELWSFPSWHRDGTADVIQQSGFAVVSAVGLLVALAVIRQSLGSRGARSVAARVDA